ncbi:AAA family ATPase [Allofrancisella guangzhouensis]|uniref:AAA family ATPase n=5 Tax=Pseudomonadota TaxID=1224 RepID=UPI00168D6434|nr:MULTISPECIES: AAA family ATPase [Francisellaceae]MBK2044670.1 AAA family ATPase [Allofrancisella guangzhouensis]MBK2045700.1 AAA family ATPase [Allofrancisella guangzhouensis]MBK2257553.1 AAA family ATPase [Francisella philomiragia]MBK2270285.1 AAA family ATPase [Francisella philomiragia]MBK2272131.1 AAA family ATPase [Francisella philomiragia]
MIFLIGGEKGGTGKSTTAFNLASYLAMNNKDVLLVDADPQLSSSKAISRRNKNYPDLFKIQGVQLSGDIYDGLSQLKKKYEYIVVDTGGRDSVELRSALLIADIFITTIRPSQIDIDTLPDLNNITKKAKAMNRGLKSYALFTHSPTNPNMDDEKEAKAILEELPEFIQTKSTLYYRSAYWRTFGNGLSVLDYIDQKAIEEINNLGKEIYDI